LLCSAFLAKTAELLYVEAMATVLREHNFFQRYPILPTSDVTNEEERYSGLAMQDYIYQLYM